MAPADRTQATQETFTPARPPTGPQPQALRTTRPRPDEGSSEEVVERSAANVSPAAAQRRLSEGHSGRPAQPDGRPYRGGPGVGSYVSPGQSILAHRRIVVLWLVVGLVVGAAYGLVRHPSYSAQSVLYVGKTESLANTSAIPGLAAAATTIAGDYSRLISIPSTLADAAKRLGVASLPGSLTASQIPQSPEIVVYATASSQATAVALANAGSKALIDSVNELNLFTASEISSLKAQYQSYEQQQALAQEQEEQYTSQLAQLEATANPSPSAIAALQAKLAVATSNYSTDVLEGNAVANEYTNNYSPVASDEDVINSTGPAGATGSDRKKRLELGVLVGAVAGLLLGVTFASMVDVRRDRRRRELPTSPVGD